MKSVCITGGAGFIGSHLAEELSRNDSSEVVVYDNLSTGNRDNLKGVRHTFIHGDILDHSSLKKAISQCEYVYHLAAATSVPESMEHPEKYINVNSHGTLNILKAAQESGVKKVVMASSAAVYGDSPELPKTETMKPDPKSVYAVTKLDGEYYCRLFSENFGLATVVARIFNVFGERQDPGSPYAAAIPIFISRIFDNKTIEIHGDGEQTRDFIYVKDIAKALAFLMGNGNGVYNIGCGCTITVNKLVEVLKSITGRTVSTQYVKERPGEIKHSYASVRKLKEVGFNPEYNLEKGLELTVAWWMEKNLHE